LIFITKLAEIPIKPRRTRQTFAWKSKKAYWRILLWSGYGTKDFLGFKKSI